jgi:putative methionine-R-sulfoxide reductase with GAF domain
MMQTMHGSQELNDQIQASLLVWRRQALDTLLRGITVVGAVALLVGSYDLLPSGRWTDFWIYAGTYASLAAITLQARRLPFPFRAGVLLTLNYAVGLWRLSSEGLSGDGRLFLITFPVLVTALHGTWPGLGALALSLSTMGGIGWAVSSGSLPAPAPTDSTELSAWVGSSAILALLAMTMMVTQRLLIQAQTRALRASLENVELQEARAALEQKTEELVKTTASLAARSVELEAANERQAEINRQLEQAARQSQRRAALLQANAEVSRAVAQIRDLDRLSSQVTHLVSQHFGFYHVGIFLVDEAGRYAVLRAASSEGGQRMLARGHRLTVGSQGIVGHVTGTGEPRIALDVDADAFYFDNPDLPHTRSEMALPLRIGDQVIGALDVHSTQEAAFDTEDTATLTVLADQVAIAIQNAHLFQQTQAALAEAQEAYRRYLRREWDSFLGKTPKGQRGRPIPQGEA